MTLCWKSPLQQQSDDASFKGFPEGQALSPSFVSSISHEPAVYLRLDEGLVAEVALTDLQSEIAATPGYIPGEKIYLLDNDGHILLDLSMDAPRPEPMAPASGGFPQQQITLQQLTLAPYASTMSGTLYWRSLPEGHHFESRTSLPEKDWVLATEIPWPYAFRTTLLWLGLAIAVVVATGLSASAGIKKDLHTRILMPLMLIGQQAEAVSQGHYATAARDLTIPHTLYELSMLARSFNHMTDALQKHERDLAEHNAQYRLLVDTSPDGILWLSPRGTIMFCNPQAAKMHGADSPTALIGLEITHMIDMDDFRRLQTEAQYARQAGNAASILLHFRRSDDKLCPIEASVALLQDEENTTRGYIVIARDISERQRNLEFNLFVNEITQLALQNTNFPDLLQEIADRLSAYFQATTCYITLWDAERKLTIPTAASGMMRSLYPTLAAHPQEGTLTNSVLKAGRVLAIEDVHDSPLADSKIAVTIPETSFLVLPLQSGEQKIGAALIGYAEHHVFSGDEIQRGEQIARQISLSLAKARLIESERRRRQEAEYLSQISATLTGNLSLPIVLNEILDTLAIVLPYHRCTIFLQEGNTLYVTSHRNGDPALSHFKTSADKNALFSFIQSTRRPLVLADASKDTNFQGWHHTSDTRGWMGVPLIANNEIIGYLTIDSQQVGAYDTQAAHIAQTFANQAAVAIENARLYHQKHQALEHANSLYRIVRRMISADHLLELLQIISNELQSTLSAYACSVLLFDLRAMQINQYAHSTLGASIHLPDFHTLLSDLHGEMLDSNMAQIETLDADAPRPAILQQMYGNACTQLQSVMIAPLRNTQGIIGSIIVVNTTEMPPYGPDDIEILTSIAHQSTVAIQNQQLVLDLKKSNDELTFSYDATIEGWSKALELRDKETLGHTMRVTTLTVRLAKFMGIPDDKLMHIRRGALLHDIGKIGIPDAILLKPGPLTDDEWQIMKQHPAYAYKLLKHIPYLQPALNIPYCHHERWDGSGYPRGLSGTQIPLEARIFAVVDVWDALTSDRPYRDGAWNIEDTLSYLHQNKGTLFDPQVVSAFAEMIRQEFASPFHVELETRDEPPPWGFHTDLPDPHPNG
ncbi:MAG: hypothetical protein Fur0018_12190 [Anaerolineales bacterium]